MKNTMKKAMVIGFSLVTLLGAVIFPTSASAVDVKAEEDMKNQRPLLEKGLYDHVISESGIRVEVTHATDQQVTLIIYRPNGNPYVIRDAHNGGKVGYRDLATNKPVGSAYVLVSRDRKKLKLFVTKHQTTKQKHFEFVQSVTPKK